MGQAAAGQQKAKTAEAKAAKEKKDKEDEEKKKKKEKVRVAPLFAYASGADRFRMLCDFERRRTKRRRIRK